MALRVFRMKLDCFLPNRLNKKLPMPMPHSQAAVFQALLIALQERWQVVHGLGDASRQECEAGQHQPRSRAFLVLLARDAHDDHGSDERNARQHATDADFVLVRKDDVQQDEGHDEAALDEAPDDAIRPMLHRPGHKGKLSVVDDAADKKDAQHQRHLEQRHSRREAMDAAYADSRKSDECAADKKKDIRADSRLGDLAHDDSRHNP